MAINATYNPDEPNELEKKLLISLVYTSDLNETEKEEVTAEINNCTTYKEFELIQYRLEVRQQNIQNIHNPSQKDILNHIMKIV